MSDREGNGASGPADGDSDSDHHGGATDEAASNPSKAAGSPKIEAPAIGAPLEKPPLRRRPFGRAQELVSELSLGTWGLCGDAYGPVYHKEVDRVIDKAIDHGISLFETADVYGDGSMERKLGERLDADEHKIVTKIGTFLGDDPARKKFDEVSLKEAFDKSQERIGRDVLDVVLLHNPSVSALEADEATGLMKQKVEDGALTYWGVSCGSPEVVEAALEAGADVIELPYNLFHQGWLHGMADEIASTDTAVLARSVLFHGLLAGHWARTKVFFDNDHRSKRWTKDELKYRLAQLPAVRQLVGGDVLTLRAAALRFVLANGLVTSAVLGPRSVTQLNQLVSEAGKEPPYLPDDALASLPERLRAVGVEV